MGYDCEPLDMQTLFAPVIAATTALARLDERLARSPVREGWIERQHFADAAATLWLEGELVHIEDLVLHDAHMDIRVPTHEVTRAHSVLRVRRQILANKPEWALSTVGLNQLTRRGGNQELEKAPAGGLRGGNKPDDNIPAEPSSFEETGSGSDALDEFDKALEAMDAALQRSSKALEGQAAAVRPLVNADRSELVYDADWNESERLATWQGVMATTKALPAVLRAAVLMDAWQDLEVLQHRSWLGPLLVAALLRQDALQDGLALHHLPSFNLGLKQIPRERRRSRDRSQRLLAFVDAIREAAILGLKEHDRLMHAQAQMQRRLKDKRKNSKLPGLIAFTIARPLITAPLVEKELKISLQGALSLIGELGLREVTGRGRYRAWRVA